ncbi:MAG TPA: adenosylcobinamide-GDP ribazoletransferase [Stellaceae bacterium]|jgi:adenosylcobinamide-GDP ribazoletransferase|nr:adenosylcobinamide-GDP ribazoletransferase [Stellaceae bacterium]
MSAFRDAWRDEFFAALTFLTRLPLGRAQADAPLVGLADTAWAFPLVGLVIGAIGGVAYAIAFTLGLPALAAALIAVAATALVTGALHEDGLADTADGFGGGATRESKLEIMRDSRIGSFGVIALVVSIGLRTIAIADSGTRWHAFLALIAAHALSRGMLPAALHKLDPARVDGLGAGAGRPEQNQVLIALAIALAIAVIATGFRAGFSAAIVAAIAALAIGWLAQRQIGGQTGDVLGAIEQGAETAALLAAAAWI